MFQPAAARTNRGYCPQQARSNKHPPSCRAAAPLVRVPVVGLHWAQHGRGLQERLWAALCVYFDGGRWRGRGPCSCCCAARVSAAVARWGAGKPALERLDGRLLLPEEPQSLFLLRLLCRQHLPQLCHLVLQARGAARRRRCCYRRRARCRGLPLCRCFCLRLEDRPRSFRRCPAARRRRAAPEGGRRAGSAGRHPAVCPQHHHLEQSQFTERTR